MKGIFDSIQLNRPKLNKFDLSHERKLSLNMGKLIPILVQDVVPGDRFRVNTEIMMRLAPMLAPVMHRVNVFTHYFFVPNRLIWDEWEDFITGGRLGTSNPVPPHMMFDNANTSWFLKGTLNDYMGLPIWESGAVSGNGVYQYSALPNRAYQLIYDEYYRDQNVQQSLDISKSSGLQSFPETEKLNTLRNRSWEKDYFTSALPWAQRGGSVNSPVNGSITPNYRPETLIRKNDGTLNPDAVGIAANGDAKAVTTGGTSPGTFMQLDNLESVDFGGSMNINDLRRSIRLQEWLERNARAGSRYIEQILAHFGVKSSDARLQRPEYLGGGKTPVVISEVVSTFQSEAEGIPQGNMAGHGYAVGNTNQFSRRFEEHGYVLGIISVLPRTAYQQGVPRHFSRFDKFDYYWPEFANIGEQAVLNKELYNDITGAVPNSGTFGYQSRYAEYKHGQSTVHGDFRTNLSYWHWGRIFNSAPSLNESFIKADPSFRPFAVEDPDIHHLYCQLYNRVDALRPMPYFGVPSF